MDKIFSIAPLLDESFLNISIKKSCTPERDTVSLCDSVAIRTQDPRLRRALLYPAELNTQMERVVGIEPTFPAWKAGVLPIYDTRIFFLSFN